VRIIEEQPGASKCNARSTYNNLVYIWDDTDSSVNVMVFEYQGDKLVEYSAVQSYKASWVVLDGLARRQHRK